MFLFSPSSSYPRPLACVIDREGRLVHTWSNTTGQPDPSTDPPTWLRGWNHVEVAADGSLYAMVPLHMLLKLRPDSTLDWQIQLPVHHDLDITNSGEIYALTEQPRIVPWSRGRHLLLDNLITVISPQGRVRHSHSIYDLLTSDPQIRGLIDHEISRRVSSAHVPPPAPPDFNELAGRRGRDVSRLLRELPGSPSDILHANTIEVLRPHPHGLWDGGDVLISLRDLDLIAVLNLSTGINNGQGNSAVRWGWGPSELSGQHQPSALPGGTVLVFDNGRSRGHSRALEIDPSTGTIVWQYTADPPHALFSAMAGGCQQLPGGTVLISDAQAGRALEVTRDGTTIWDLQIHTSPPTSEAVSRCEIYRIAAVPASTAARLTGEADHARRLAHTRVQCQTRRVPLHDSLNGILPAWSGP